MKIKQITEATNKNLKLVKEITNRVLEKLPETLSMGSGVGSPNAYKIENINTSDLKKEYPEFEEFLDYISETTFRFINSPEHERNSTFGFYDPDNNNVGVNIAGILGYYPEHKKQTLIKPDTNVMGIRAVLYHEIRHIMQDKDYPDFFKSEQSRSKDYKKRDIEIDAMWYNIIGVYNPKQFKPKAFAHRVMDDLKNFRDLSKKQYDHYYKKTLKYYSNPEYFKDEPRSKENIIQNILPKKVSKIISNKSQFDLRELPNYSKDNFLFPIENVSNAVNKALSTNTTNNDFQKNMLFIIPSFFMPKRLAKIWQIYMKQVHDYTIDDVINNFNQGIPANHFDDAAIKKYLKSFYNNRINEGKFGDIAKAGAVAISSMMPMQSHASAPETSIRPIERNISETITNKKEEQALLNSAKDFGIKGDELAALMANAYHETLGFTRLSEMGNKEYFKRYNTPKMKKRLGNTEPEDAYAFRGRGFLHLTGRYNYEKFQKAFKIPVVDNPDLVETNLAVALKSALYFWATRVQKRVSDFSDTKAARRAVNGGLNGIEQYEKLFQIYQQRIKQ